MGRLDKDQIEKYLMDRMNKLTQKYLASKTESLGKFSSSLVETLNDELPKKCPSVEGFKYVVHATVQDNYGQGSLLGGQCQWDPSTDDFVKANLQLQKLNLGAVVFFVSIDDEEVEEKEGE